MLAIVALVFAGLALLIAAGTLLLLWFAAKGLVKAVTPEPRIDKGELYFDHPAPEAGDTRLRMPTGLVSYIDSSGVLRTERGILDPLAGQVRGDQDGSPTGPLAQVIALHKRTAAEQ
jgi:hypothetical protein